MKLVVRGEGSLPRPAKSWVYMEASPGFSLVHQAGVLIPTDTVSRPCPWRSLWKGGQASGMCISRTGLEVRSFRLPDPAHGSNWGPVLLMISVNNILQRISSILIQWNYMSISDKR